MVLQIPLSQRGPYAYVYARGWPEALRKVKPIAAPPAREFNERVQLGDNAIVRRCGGLRSADAVVFRLGVKLDLFRRAAGLEHAASAHPESAA